MTQLGYEINTQKYARPYIQFGGARPNSKPLFYGGETNYFMIGGASFPMRGSVSPIWTRSRGTLDAFDLVGRTIEAPDIPEATLTFREKVGTIPRHLLAMGCEINAYVLRGQCKSLDSFDAWESYVQIFGGGLVTDRSRNDENSWEDDEAAETEVTAVWRAIYPAGQIGFTEANATGITLQVTDITYANRTVCGECGPANDGTQWIYAVETGAVAADPIVHYSVDGGLTWAQSSITTAASAEAPNAIRVMGNYLVVLSPTAQGATQGGMYISSLNTTTGVPSSTWTMITSGFTAAQEPRDMVVIGPREAYICCDGGVILRVTDPASGATSLGAVSASDLARIHASPSGDAIVAVGAAAAVVKSTNRGASFSATTTNPGAAALTAVNVMDKNRFWVGDTNGILYYTLDGGGTAWTTKALGVTPTAIQDIRFTTQECGFVAYTLASLGRVAATLDGGYSWMHSQNVQPRLSGVNPAGTSQRYNRIAYPGVADAGINANYISLAGLGVTTDGALLIGAGNVF